MSPGSALGQETHVLLPQASARVPTEAVSFMATREAAHFRSPRGRAARRQAADVGETLLWAEGAQPGNRFVTPLLPPQTKAKPQPP